MRQTIPRLKGNEMNLNTMTPEELIKFSVEVRAHPIQFAREHLSGRVGSRAAARDLAHYALNFALAKQSTNELDRAEYLRICSRIKQDLPAYALPLVQDVIPVTPEA
jgi:hypothetical protein